MFCGYCGYRNRDSAKFCRNCGKPLIQAAPEADAQPQGQMPTTDVPEIPETPVAGASVGDVSAQSQALPQQSQPQAQTQPSPQESASAAGDETVSVGEAASQVAQTVKRLPRKIVYCAIGAVAVLIVLFAFVIPGCVNTVDLGKYMRISAYGYDGIGHATLVFDEAAFQKDWQGRLDLSNNLSSDSKSYMSWFYGSTANAAYGTVVQYARQSTLSKDAGLSNGDTVYVTWSVDEKSLSNDLNVTVKMPEVSYVVTGLTEVEKFNPFDHATVSFTGTKDYAQVKCETDTSIPEMQYIKFSVNKSTGLTEGEEVVLTATLTLSEDDFVAKFNKVPSGITKSYKVENLPVYLKKLDDLDDKTNQSMEQQLRDDLAMQYQGWRNQNLVDMKLLGNYLLVKKEGATASGLSTSGENLLYYVYEVTANNDLHPEGFKYYWYGYYRNILVYDDGTCEVNLKDYGQPDTGWFSSETYKPFSGEKYFYYGYGDLGSLFDKIVTPNTEKYTYESTVPNQSA